MAGSIGWGILATGGIADRMARDMATAGIRIAAVGSRRADAAADFAAAHGIPTAHDSYEALVADPGVDAVYVASPHSHHLEHATLALEAGKHVLVEKAYTLTAPQAEQLVSLALERGLIAMEAMWTRFLPATVGLKAKLDDGIIGALQSFQADHSQSLNLDPAKRLLNPDLGGGALLDLGVYPASFADWLFGEPERIQADAVLASTGVDARIAVQYRYASGAQASFTSCLDAAGPNRASIIGSDGWVELDRTWYQGTGYTVHAPDGTVRERVEAGETGLQFEALEVERLIEAGERDSATMSAASSLRIMRAMDEIRRQVGVRYAADGDPAAS